MTRQEAIGVIKDFVAYGEHVNAFVYKGSTSIPIEALNMAIKALEQIESGRYVKGECSICLEEFGTLGCCTTVSNHWVYSCKEGMAQYAEALKQEPKRGKWIDYTDDGFVECPFCHSATNCEGNIDELKYCYSCGARLESKEE